MANRTDQALKSREVLLAGAGSQIGIFAIARLLDAGFELLAISRSGRPDTLPAHPAVQWISEPDAIRVASGCRYLLSAGPLDLALRLCVGIPGLQRAVVFSSTSVISKQHSRDHGEKELATRMLDLEAQLLSLAGDRNISMSILRPTLVYGCGLDANVSRLAEWIRRFGFVPVSGRAGGLRQPVHADDLASVAVRALTGNAVLPDRLSVAGGETLSYEEMVRRIFQALEKPERLLKLPEWVFALLAAVVGFFRPSGGINAQMVRRQATDLVFDDSEARTLLGYDPRPFRPGKDDFSLPLPGNHSPW